MSETTWKRVEKLFEEVLNQDPDERIPFLVQACGGNEHLRREVESLLASHDTAGSYLEDVVSCAEQSLSGHQRAQESSFIGRVFGDYRLIKILDSGGMGAVYLAARADKEFEKRVAVKLVKGGVVDRESLRRFLLERQALAHLEHANIARLIDGGTTEDGMPYLVMEYVEGERIDRYCAHHARSVRARLEIFLDVCDAVHHAHRHLVVHRDLKPANILVTREGTPKLLDFGIAKILGPKLVRTTTERLFTPEYASPEQLEGRAVTTATDVYSLGVLLYELLCGTRPFEASALPTPELVRAICDEEPLRPSARLVGEDGARTRRRIAGDLDNIVLMALRKEPERRYGSVEQLATDIRRHLDGLPVSARKDTFRYRTEKFVRRNKAIVLTTSLLILTFVAAWIRERKTLAREREQTAQKGRLLSTSMEMLETFPFIIQGSQGYRQAVEMLDGWAEIAAETSFDDARFHLDFLNRLARGYSGLGLSARRRTVCLRALEIAQLLGDELLLSDALHSVGRVEEAYKLRQGLLEPPHPKLAESLTTLAWNGATSSPLESSRLYQRAQNMLRECGADEQLVKALRSEANLLHSYFGDNATALERVNEAVRIAISLDSPNEILVESVLNSRAWLLQDMARYEEAERDFLKVLAIFQRTYPRGHPESASRAHCLAMFYKDTERFEQAEEYIDWAQEVPPYARTITMDLAPAKLYADWGRWEEAEPYARRESEGEKAKANDLTRADRHTLLGRILIHLGREAEALPLLEEAHRIREEKLAPARWERHKTASVYGHVLARLGRFEMAERILLESVPRVCTDRGDDHYRSAQARYRLVDLYERWGKPDEAAKWRERITPESRRHRIVRSTIGSDLD